MLIHTVDGGHPAPPGMYKTLLMGYTTYQLVQDFFHQQYEVIDMDLRSFKKMHGVSRHSLNSTLPKGI